MISITPFLAALLAVSFPFKGTIRSNSGTAIPGLTSQMIDIRLYSEVDKAEAIWGHRYTVDLQTNGMFTVELSDSTGSKIPDGTGIVTKDQTLVEALTSIGSNPLYAGMTIVTGTGVEMKPRARIMPIPAAKIALDADEAATTFVLSENLALQKKADIAGDLTASESAKVAELQGTGGMQIGGELKTKDAIVGAGGLTIAHDATVGGLAAKKVTSANVSANEVAVTDTLTADEVALAPSSALPDYTPKGMIVMWYGDANNPPQDWAICNGQTANGVKTPDLRDRFIVGASKSPAQEGKTYSVGNTGGAEEVTLDTSNLPKHSHSFGDTQVGRYTWSLYAGDEVYTYRTTYRLVGLNTSAVGGGKSHPNLPPYHGVYFLMKVK